MDSKKFLKDALNANMVCINEVTWFVFAAFEDGENSTFTLARPTVLPYSGDVTAIIEDFSIQDLLSVDGTVTFIPADYSNGVQYSNG